MSVDIMVSVWKSASLFGLTAALLACASMQAADSGTETISKRDSLRYEVAPFVGYRMSGGFRVTATDQSVDIDDHGSFALALGLQADEDSRYELFYGRQSSVLRSGTTFAPTGIKVEYLHLGGTYVLNDEYPVKPYLGGGLGITRFSPDPAFGHENTRFSGSLALGLRVPFNRHFLLRAETRGYLTLVNSDTAFFCRSDQGGLLCRIHSRGSTFTQGDLLIGVAYEF